MLVKTIKELHEKVQSGEIDESKLSIFLDYEYTAFVLNLGENEEEKIKVEEAKGNYDVQKLYSLMFPKAKIEWC